VGFCKGNAAPIKETKDYATYGRRGIQFRFTSFDQFLRVLAESRRNGINLIVSIMMGTMSPGMCDGPLHRSKRDHSSAARTVDGSRLTDASSCPDSRGRRPRLDAGAEIVQ